MALLKNLKSGDQISIKPSSGATVILKLDDGNQAEVQDVIKDTIKVAVTGPAAAAAAAVPTLAIYYPATSRYGNIYTEDDTTALIEIGEIIKSLDTEKKIENYYKRHKITMNIAEDEPAFKKAITDAKTAIDTAEESFFKSAKDSGAEKKYTDDIKVVIASVFKYFTKELKVSGASSSGRAAAPAKETDKEGAKIKSLFDSGGGAMLSGGADSILKRLKEIETEKARIPSGIALLSVTSASLKKQYIDTIAALKLEENKIKTSAEYLSMRGSTPVARDRYKINEEEYIINSAIEAIKNNKNNTVSYQFTHTSGTPITITDFNSLRTYILEYSNDPITLLLKLTDLSPISLDDFLPKIEDDKLTISRNEKGILVVNINDEKVEMPNPLGNKNNRQEFSTKYKANSCYGLGGNQSDSFCVNILNKCLASDEKSLQECRKLFTSSDWEKIKAEGIKNSNIYLIKEFLLKIGYPRINDRFDTNIDTWFDIVKSRYSANDTVLGKIKTNDKLKEVIVDMVEKYNRINDLEKKSRSTSSRNFHLPMKGGENMSIINSNLYELYGGLNQNVVNLPSLSPSQKIYNIFKELVKDQDITSKYRNFFDKMEKNIENQNYNIDSSVRNNFNVLLTSFKQSEEKLNKLLQTMHNFAWFLGQTVNTSNLSEADKKINATATEKLNKVLNQENINAYNAAREKLVNSLNKKSQKLISIAAGHPFILIASS